MPSNSEAPANIIEVRDLTVGYGDVEVLKDISFDVRRGEVFVILGGSGCGKSTLLKHMIGLFPPMKGSVKIEGRDLVTAEGRERQDILKRIGVSYQSGALFGSMTLAENVQLPLTEYTDLPPAALDLLAWMKLRLVGLEKSRAKLPSELSGGMQKRAAIARAMALDPAVVFLDEPSAGLDPITSADLDALILRLRETVGTTFVIVTHELPSIYAVADRVIMLDKETKGIIAEGRPEDLRDHSDVPFVRQFFHREATEEAAA
ncbi:MAG TPA: ATP-binding cassette domain-containing protein [Chthoniobacterales bacterium]